MKCFIICGERSGDLHAGNLAAALKDIHPEVQMQGWGGDQMRAAGVEVLQDYEELAIMGFVEVLKNLGKIKGFMESAKAQIGAFSPDVLVLVDYAGFNLRLASWAKSKGYKVVYYIPPKAWAWNRSRAHKLRTLTDLTLAIFPFEVPFFKEFGVNVKYVGNPLFDAIRKYEADGAFLQKWEGKKVVALLPGSRKQEIEAMLETMAEISKQVEDYTFIVAGVSSFSEDFYRSKGGNFELVYGKTYDLLSIASAAVVTSGTATLETALFKVPQVVVYKTNPVTYAIAKLLVKIKFISLVNLVADKEVVKELIQSDYTAEKTLTELKKLLFDNKSRQKQLDEYAEIIRTLGVKEASRTAAEEILIQQNK
jgi:lipid-A-disaccharide synthase